MNLHSGGSHYEMANQLPYTRRMRKSSLGLTEDPIKDQTWLNKLFCIMAVNGASDQDNKWWIVDAVIEAGLYHDLACIGRCIKVHSLSCMLALVRKL